MSVCLLPKGLSLTYRLVDLHRFSTPAGFLPSLELYIIPKMELQSKTLISSRDFEPEIRRLLVKGMLQGILQLR